MANISDTEKKAMKDRCKVSRIAGLSKGMDDILSWDVGFSKEGVISVAKEINRLAEEVLASD